MSSGGSGRQTLTEINVTPLVDVMLVLLIIFMVTAPLIQQGVEVALPEARAKAVDADEQKLVLSIKADKSLWLGTSEDAAAVPMDALEDKLHNPTAEVVYDILAMRGGTRLYSRLAPLHDWAVESEGAPTSGMTQVLEAQENELTQLERETRNFLEEEIGTLNAQAARLGLSFVIVR